MHTCLPNGLLTYRLTYVLASVHTYMLTYIHTYMHTYTYTHTCTHMHTCMHTYIHRCTRTYIPKQSTNTCTETKYAIHLYVHAHAHLLYTFIYAESAALQARVLKLSVCTLLARFCKSFISKYCLHDTTGNQETCCIVRNH